MATKVTNLIVLLAVGLSCLYHAMESASVSSTKTTEPVTTESTCRPPVCRPLAIGSRCFLACDPTNCTPPRCVCGFGVSYFMCPQPQCAPGATPYRPPYYFACPRCVCLPKRCATCDPNNTTIPNYPECACPTCQCIDGQCINNSTTTDSTTESHTTAL